MNSETATPAQRARGRWTDHCDPKDRRFRQATAGPITKRNLWTPTLAEHGFDFTTKQKFLLVSVVAFVGSALAAPTLPAVLLTQNPGTPFWLFALLTATDSAAPAFMGLLVFYATCIALTYTVYVPTPSEKTSRSGTAVEPVCP